MNPTLAEMFDIATPLKGHWRFEFFDLDGVLVERADYENLIVNVGKAQVLNRLYNLGAAAAIVNTGVGTSNTAAAVGNTGLTGGVFKVFDATPTAASAGTLEVVSTTTFGTSEANIVIAEACICTASPGVILNRLAPIGPFTKTTAVSLAVTVTITQA